MIIVTIQQMAKKQFSPKPNILRRWAKHILTGRVTFAEITLRLVTIEEMSQLNETYRKKKGPTNVLAFPLMQADKGKKLIGDVVICSEVVNQEANIQNKTAKAYWAHMVVHGLLHLLGYNHEEEQEALIMEKQEVTLLKSLQFSNPYYIPSEGNR